MGWKRNFNPELPENTRVRWKEHEGHVEVVPARTPESFIRVAGLGPFGYINYIYHSNLEVWEEPAPEPKKPEYRETDYYVETLTGAIYKRQFSSDCHWYLICANQIKPSIPVTGCVSSIPKNFKRLYREA